MPPTGTKNSTVRSSAAADDSAPGWRFFADAARFCGIREAIAGTASRVGEKQTEQRDLDVTIEPYKKGGFTIKWITVVRGADGQRVDDDVKRREVEENFIPLEDKENVYILAPKGGLFQKAELPNPLRGEPMRWATIENGAMTIYSMAITNAGGAELQVYRRTLTDKGIDISFLRMHDEKVVVHMEGTLVRTK